MQMKIILTLLTTLLISACASVQTENLYQSDITIGNDSDCSKSEDLLPEVDFATIDNIFLLTVNRYLYKTIGLIVLDDENEYTLLVTMMCSYDDPANKFLRIIVLTKEQMSEIYTLFEDIDIPNLPIVDTSPIAISFGYSFWGLQVIENKRELALITASSPGYLPETKEFFRLGQYLWNLAGLDSPLQYKDIVKSDKEIKGHP